MAMALSGEPIPACSSAERAGMRPQRLAREGCRADTAAPRLAPPNVCTWGGSAFAVSRWSKSPRAAMEGKPIGADPALTHRVPAVGIAQEFKAAPADRP